MDTVSETFAKFVSEVEFDHIPPDVITTARLVFLDIIGVALAASTSESGRAAIGLARSLGGKAESQVIGAPFKTSSATAVLANSTLAHALDYDETLEEGIIHAGCCVVPTALAAGEALGASGKSILEAAVAGFEIMFTLGVAAPGGFHARGFHPTAITAPFGAAAVAGRLMGLEVKQFTNAFGIAGSQSSGIIEYLADGSWTKQFHAGWAAHAGIIAALLAKEGFQGPHSVFEGKHGLFAAFAMPDLTRIKRLQDIGRQWYLPKVVFKLYPCGSIAHPYIDCALRIRNTSGFKPADIESVQCRTHEGPVPRLWEPIEVKRQPPTPYAAKFSLPYCVAAALVKGRVSLTEFSDAAIKDPETLRVAQKITYTIDSSLDYPRHFSGHVRVVMRDGRVLEENQPHTRGSVESPIEPHEIQTKFRQNAGSVLPSESVDQIVEFMTRLEHAPDAAALSRLLAC